MNEATLVLDESHATSTSTEKEPNAAEYDARVAVDADASRLQGAPRPSSPT